MAHNLNKNKDGQFAFASVREIPWHNLGQIVEKKMTAADAIKFAKLDYDVDKTPVIVKIDNKTSTLEEKFVTYRTDTNDLFGVIGSKYEIVQNRDAFSFFDSIVGEGEAIYETAGALGKGERIFITAKLPENIQVGKDVIDQYIFLTSSHDGTGSIKAAFTPVRIVCANTLHMALSAASRMVSIRHTKSAQEQLKIAHKLMGIVIKESELMSSQLNQMVKVKITDKELLRFIELAMNPAKEEVTDKKKAKEISTRTQNVIEDVLEYANTNPTQQTKETKGTLYGAYNSISGYYQNVMNYTSPEQSVNSIVYGTGMRRTARALDIALDVISKNVKLS